MGSVINLTGAPKNLSMGLTPIVVRYRENLIGLEGRSPFSFTIKKSMNVSFMVAK